MEHIVFSVGAEEYAVPITQVKEVQHAPQIISLPGAPASIDGVVNVRNHSVAVIQLQKRFGLAPQEGQGQVVVIALQGIVFGVVVDRVSGIVDLETKTVDSAPEGKFVSGIAHHQGRTIFMLDTRRLLDPQELGRLRSNEQPKESV